MFKGLTKNSLLNVSTPEHEDMMLSRNIGHRLHSDAIRSLKNGDPNCAKEKSQKTGTMIDSQILNKDSDFCGHNISTAVI